MSFNPATFYLIHIVNSKRNAFGCTRIRIEVAVINSPSKIAGIGRSVEAPVKEDVIRTLKEKGAYFLNEAQQGKMSEILLRENGTLNPAIVGKPASVVAQLAEIDVPENAELLIAEQTTVSKENPYSGEKLSPILTMYTVNNWEEGIERVSQLLNNQGIGHTAMLHSTDQQKIEAFGLAINASCIMVNTGGTFGGIGMTTRLAPFLTLGCGTAGRSSTTDNISVEQLLNIRRVATHCER